MRELIWNIVVLIVSGVLIGIGHPIVGALFAFLLLTDFKSNITVKDKEIGYDSTRKRRSTKSTTK